MPIQSRAWLARTLGQLGPSPRAGATGGGAPPRHAGRPRGYTDHCPRLPRPPVPRPRGPGARHPGVGARPGPLSCLRRTELVALILADLGAAAVLQGHLAEGHALLEESIREDIRRHAGSCQPGRAAQRGLSSGGTRRGGLAARCQALDLAGSARNAGSEALALHQGVSMPTPIPPMSRRPKPTTSRPWPWPALGMRPLQAHCHRGLGCMPRRQREQARHLSTALDLYRTMDMTFWLPQTEALAQVRASRGIGRKCIYMLAETVSEVRNVLWGRIRRDRP